MPVAQCKKPKRSRSFGTNHLRKTVHICLRMHHHSKYKNNNKQFHILIIQSPQRKPMTAQIRAVIFFYILPCENILCLRRLRELTRINLNKKTKITSMPVKIYQTSSCISGSTREINKKLHSCL